MGGDDGKIVKLIESMPMGFTMGAVMFLETSREVNYKPRIFRVVNLLSQVKIMVEGYEENTNWYD